MSNFFRSRDAANIQVMDVDQFIKTQGLKEVTSIVIKDLSGSFGKDGLFSETIFGEIGTPERLNKFGYISLSKELNVITPAIYDVLISLKAMYTSILSGKQFAIFDKVKKDFILASQSDAGARTGYNFFIEHIDKIEFNETASDKRAIKLDILKKYKDKLMIDKVLVLPAGIRDLRNENGRLVSDDINTLYLSLINISKAMPKRFLDIDIYSQLRYNAQIKVYEIYKYIKNLIEGKRGFFQGKVNSRSIVLGTRNVISATSLSATSPKDPKLLKVDEVNIPLSDSLKGSQPLIIHSLKTLFFDSVFSNTGNKILAIDKMNLNLEYINVSNNTKDNFLHADKLEKLINAYIKDEEIRFSYVTVNDVTTKKDYYLYLVYSDGDSIYIDRDVAVFKAYFKDKFNIKKISPLTLIEMFYIATYLTVNDKYSLITRFPVVAMGGIFPAKQKTTTTVTSRTIKLSSLSESLGGIDTSPIVMPHYPVIDSAFVDCIQVHPSKLAIIGGDHDGDMVSNEMLLTKESNEEVADYFKKLSSIIDPNGKLFGGANTTLIEWAMYNIGK